MPPQASASANPDAIVIGGGVMGLGIARELRRRGLSVRLLERAQPGRGASWASAGIIGATTRNEADPSYALRQTSHALWPAFAAALEEESGTDPEYRETGCLYLANSDEELRWLQAVVTQRGTRLLDEAALRDLEPALGSSVKAGAYVEGGNVEPRRLCRALEISTRRLGVDIRTGVEVRALLTSGEAVTGVEASDGTHSAERVVLAAGAWSATIRGLHPDLPVYPQRGQILALDQTRVGIRHVLLTPGDPYFVPRCDGRLVIGATREDTGWDASLTVGGIAWLLERAVQVAPQLKECSIAEMWTGFRPMSADGVPMIGAGALSGLYFLTGHGPSGISPLPGSLALLMSIMFDEAPPSAPAPFDPLRFL